MLRDLAQGDLVEADAFVPVDLADVLDAAVADLRRERPQARVRLTAQPGLRVHGWPQGLRSAVDNLLANAAVHGAGSDGTARIEVALGPGAGPGAGRGAGRGAGPGVGRGAGPGDTADGEGPVVVLTVDDHGPGVPPEARQEIFQRFRRRPRSPGSGLGLALVGQQIALHAGRVTVGDRPDGSPGARFTVVLPLGTAGGRLPGPGGRDWLAGASARTPGPRGEPGGAAGAG
jgi:two-component system sensor histidine kinase PrrB